MKWLEEGAAPTPRQESGSAVGTGPEAVITIRLDGTPLQVPHGSYLADLVAAAGHAPTAVATALNGNFVPRQQRADVLLQPGDEVLMFQPIVGG